MNYIKISGATSEESQARTAQINNLLYQITRIGEPQEDDVTNKVFPEAFHKDTGEAALQVGLTYGLRMNNVPKAQMLVTFLNGALPQEELDEKLQYIEDNQGEVLEFGDILPPSEPIFTYEELLAEGWFIVEE